VWRRVRYLLLLVTLCALATCPSGLRRHRARQRALEAPALLEYMTDRVRAVWKERGRLPQGAAGPTPPLGTCCTRGGRCPADPAAWRDPAWRVLAFSIDGAHRYSYQYEVVDGGHVAILRAIGDVDCDGASGTYEVRLTPAGGDLAAAWSRQQPYE